MASNPNRPPGDGGAARGDERVRGGLGSQVGQVGGVGRGGSRTSDETGRTPGSRTPGSRTPEFRTPDPRPDPRRPAPVRHPAPVLVPEAARRRSPPPSPESTTLRARVEVTLNELTGTMSWRTLGRA